MATQIIEAIGESVVQSISTSVVYGNAIDLSETFDVTEHDRDFVQLTLKTPSSDQDVVVITSTDSGYYRLHAMSRKRPVSLVCHEQIDGNCLSSILLGYSSK